LEPVVVMLSVKEVVEAPLEVEEAPMGAEGLTLVQTSASTFQVQLPEA
jgi:hypothetical protein